jgi:hypothetical protein
MRKLYSLILVLVIGLTSEAQPQYWNRLPIAGANLFPFGINPATGKKVQWAIAAGEFNQPTPAPASNITSVWFRPNAANNTTFTTLTIRMATVSTSTFIPGLGQWYTGPMTTVLSQNTNMTALAALQWVEVPLTTAFPYDPTMNLIIEIYQCGYTGPGFTINTDVIDVAPHYRRQYSDAASMCGVTVLPGGGQFNVPAIGLTLGPVVSWLGVDNSGWFSTSNWSSGTVPTSGTDVTIHSGTPNPCVIPSGTAEVHNLTIQSGASLTNNGALNINGGGVFTNNGTYKGSGAFSGALFTNPVGGVVSPGNSPGCLTYLSGFNNMGTMNIEVNGTTACTQYDRITVTGGTTLSGTLNATIGYPPTTGDQVSFIVATDAMPVSGTFTTVTAPSGWTVLYNNPSAGSVTLKYDPCASGPVHNITQATNYCTIQAAVAAANPGDVINVDAGTYNVNQIIIDKKLEIHGAGAATTTIDGGDFLIVSAPGSEPGTFFINATDALSPVVIDGFKFINPSKWQDGGDEIVSVASGGTLAPLTISNCHFVGESVDNVSSLFDNNIWIYWPQGGSTVNIINNEFEHAWQSILIELPNPGVTISGNNFHDLFTSGGNPPQAMSLWAYGGLDVTNPILVDANTFSNYDGWSVVLRGGGAAIVPAGTENARFLNSVTISNNEISADGAGIVLRNPASTLPDAAQDGIVGATITNNKIASLSATGSGIWLRGPNDNAEIHSNSITGYNKAILSEPFNVAATSANVDAECNWYGSSSPGTVTSRIDGPAIDYEPFLTNGMDNSGAMGFQPVPGSCNGSLTCTGNNWLGTANNDWFNPSNWSCGFIPTAASDVTIPPIGGTVLYQPVIGSGTANAHNLNINASATLTISLGATLNINGGGVVTNNGTLFNNGIFNQ